METEPIDAMRERIKELFEITAEDVTAIEANARRNEIIALAAFREGQSSPKIKQLEWDFYDTYYSTETPVFDYLITQENDFVENDGDYALWVNGFPISHSTLEEAKDAAQADFERRVKECLDL